MDLRYHEEGWVEWITWVGDCARVTLSLGDGSPLELWLESDEAAWLGLAVGQIVRIPRDSASDPRGAVLRQRTDFGGQGVARNFGQRDRLQDCAHVGA
jgi:hypothetical protein